MKAAYLGLGTNLGDREANLRQAADLLASDRLAVKRASSLYETAPRDVLDQPYFLNQVLEIETDLFPRQLFERAKKIEREMGRVRSQPKGPRLIDIDILLYGDAVVKTDDLDIPHVAIPERRFVLEPLAELVPELRHPVTKKTIVQMLNAVRDQAVKRLPPAAERP